MRELERSPRGGDRGHNHASVFLQPRFCKFKRVSVVCDRSVDDGQVCTESRLHALQRETTVLNDAHGHGDDTRFGTCTCHAVLNLSLLLLLLLLLRVIVTAGRKYRYQKRVLRRAIDRIPFSRAAFRLVLVHHQGTDTRLYGKGHTRYDLTYME